MKTLNHQIGIEININYINAVLVSQQDRRWKINAFWQFLLPFNNNIDHLKLRNILRPWRQTLPPINNVTVSLPDIYESYHTIPLPNPISLTPAACYRLAQLHATSHTQTTKTVVNYDYRQNNQNLAIHLYPKNPIDHYIALFSSLNLAISAIDTPACSLRYLASYLGLPSNCILIYCEDKKMYWVSSDENMPHYGTLYYENERAQEISFHQLAKKYQWQREQCYFAGDNSHNFSHLMPIWPDITNSLFQKVTQKKELPLIALGLALGPWEELCIK
ncbi:PilM family type IV pilus biogenesis protein [Proteus hauseri ATCC 700826]|uniref:PilM family type IV pilus biogenesis protein n=1 Tax=Proteus hauseri ATCC 700826 TaxID=1354271 RepID=A0AAJ3HUZ3_PROHU|nr:hypothetical protein [Proteus hauseri]OAT50904.1 PilM family type IV pilus biogenesis protein [Proteus hauseri ATCC 700826]